MSSKKLLSIFIAVGLLTNSIVGLSQQKDPYLLAIYNDLHQSSVQEKFKRLAPIPVGVVYVQQPQEGETAMRNHFKLMKQLGYNCLKQIVTVPGWTIEEVQLIALDEGIIPWWYGEGGNVAITDSLLDVLHIPKNSTPKTIRENQTFQAFQQEVFRKRILNTITYNTQHQTPLKDRSVAYEPAMGGRGFDLTPQGKTLFKEWVRKKYVTIQALNYAWNQHHAGLQAQSDNKVFSSWADFELRYEQLDSKEYKHLQDILSFKVAHAIEEIRHTCEDFKRFDANAAFRGGGEIGLFHPLAWYGVDMEKIADLMKDYGSFYPSVHFAWHFAEVDYELLRPYYMQASLANDFFKGAWAASWESTGGPQQFSGGKGGAMFTVDGKTMKQFILSQIAAGFKGWGTWAWNVRTAGWEAGEYGLLDRNNQVTDRAIITGHIGKKANEYRDELWQARKEPLVGVLYDWENEAMWATMTAAGRDEFKYTPVKARIGVSRALINGNIPFEYVTATDLRKGLANRYKVIYLPAILALNEDLLPILKKYVAEGGRLVMDAPTAYYNQNGALFATQKGSGFEEIFGATIQDYQGSGVNQTYLLNQLSLSGFILNIELTKAKPLAFFNDKKVAISEHTFGKGSAIIMGYEASTSCTKPNNLLAEKLLQKTILGSCQPIYTCTNAIVYRLATPEADHYFIMNEGKAKNVRLTLNNTSKRIATEILSNKKINLNQAFSLSDNESMWLRVSK